VLAAITWPPFGVALYVGVIVGTHLTGFMNLVETNSGIHDAEHALYLISGYLYFLPLIGREPIRWRVSYPSRIFLLFIAMPVDAFTGLVLGSEGRNPFPGLADGRPSWAPSPLSDVHIGGAVMWVGGAGIMFGLVMAVFFAWSREKRADGGLGWLESARRSNFATLVSSHQDAREGTGLAATAAKAATAATVGTVGTVGTAGSASAAGRREENVDDDEHLAAYNAFLARINKPQDG
jgi:putative copper resistance protein D